MFDFVLMNFGEYLRYLLLMIFAPRSLKTMEWRMLKLLNKDRKRHGLKPVRMQDDLRDVARKHSSDMAKKDYFDHVNLKSQSPSDRLKGARVSDVISGENLAKVGGYGNPTQFAEKGLMNSPGHRANILNGLYNAVGIGVVRNPRKVYFFTQNFAKRYLIFRKRIPKTVGFKHGLHLKGDSFSQVHKIICHVKKPKIDTVLQEHLFEVKNGVFSFTVAFDKRGNYEVWLYVDSGQQGKYTLANHFLLKVRKGLFF